MKEADFDISLPLGSIAIAVILVILIILMVLLCVRFEASDKKNSFLKALRADLHPQKRWLVILYYLHFFIIRITVLILVGLSTVISAEYLWIILSVVQVGFLVLSVLRMFESWFNCFMNIYTECQTTMFIIFATANTFNLSVPTRV